MRLQCLVYRAHHPRWAFDPASEAGAARHGGRFNPPGLPALYTARRMQTAWLEAQQAFVFKAQPMTLCAYEVDCTDVVDLTDPAELSARAVKPGDLACAWEDLSSRGGTPPSWQVADRLRKSGVAAIIVPSFAAAASREDRNVVFWDWHGPPHRVQVVDDQQRLPHDTASWQQS